MRYDATHPTIAGLQAARSTSAFFRTEPATGPGPEGLLIEALSSALRPGTAVVRRPIVDTPRGPVTALLAVVSRGRRVAVLDHCGGDGPERAALVLVYGTFDAVYLVRRSDLLSRAPRVAATVVDREPRLFTPAGRRALALCSYAQATTGRRATRRLDRGPVSAAASGFAHVMSMRLNRPAEWSAAFEAVLAPHGYALSA